MKRISGFTALILLANSGWAADTERSAAQANNPLANMTAFNMQNYYIGDVGGTDKDANQFWLRYASPFSLGKSHWFLRLTLIPHHQQKDIRAGMAISIPSHRG